MAFAFTCPFCHHQTKVDDKFAGKSGPCASCGRQVLMPSYDSQGKLVAPPLRSIDQVSQRKAPSVMTVSIVLASTLLGLMAMFIAWLFAAPWLEKQTILISQKQDIANMQVIAKALNAYADRYGTYPPSTVRADDGTPLYSWRVLLLPFMGYESQYENFVLDQPHDSAANLNAALDMPDEFASHRTNGKKLRQPNYALIVGNGTLFPGSGPAARENIDQPTLLLVETTFDLQSWTEPGDIDVLQGARPGNRALKDLGGIYPDSFTAVSTQGDGFIFPNNVSGAVLDSLITPFGGEIVDLTPFQANR